MRRLVIAASVLGSMLLAPTVQADGNRGPLAPAGPEGGPTITDGTMEILVVNGCYALIMGTVATPNVGVEVTAAINMWDDGNYRGGYPLSFPGNGGNHNYCLVHQQTEPVLQGAAGLGVYLEDQLGVGATVTFDSNGNLDISDICTGAAPVCPAENVLLDIPTMGRTGLVAMILLLGATAAIWIARRRVSLTR